MNGDEPFFNPCHNPDDINYIYSESTTSLPSGVSQYFESKGHYLPCGNTIKILPSGIYELCHDGDKNPSFKYVKTYLDDLIEFPGSVVDEVVKEIDKFWTLENRFKDLKILYKRGILLYGLPGTGKSATVAMATNRFLDKHRGVVFYPKNLYISSGLLKNFRSIEPYRPAIIILEDIDKMVSDVDSKKAMLSILDGEDKIGGVVFIGTSNDPGVLEKNIINRPSRFDRSIEVPPLDSEMRRKYLAQKLVNDPKEGLDVWIKSTEGMTVAHLKELVVSVSILGNDFKVVIERLKRMNEMNALEIGNKSSMGFEA